MAKRFTDTDKWKKRLLKSMPAEYKLLWFYICDDCDHAGIWNVDIEIACLRIGETVTAEKAVEIFGEKIRVFDGGEKWFIPGFIDFQYGELNEKNRVHESIIKILNKYGLLENKPLTSPLQGVKDKDKDKVKEKDQEKIKAAIEKLGPDFEPEWQKWKDYKQSEFKFKYKSPMSEAGALSELVKLSGGKKIVAIQIIQKSISSSWKGFFELDTPGSGQGSPSIPPAPVVTIDQKTPKEINFLYEAFLEDKCTTRSIEYYHYHFLKKESLFNFSGASLDAIEIKASDYIREKKLTDDEETKKKFMKKYAVLEFFRMEKEAGKQIIFNLTAA